LEVLRKTEQNVGYSLLVSLPTKSPGAKESGGEDTVKVELHAKTIPIVEAPRGFSEQVLDYPSQFGYEGLILGPEV
jgi:hypothetical protein